MHVENMMYMCAYLKSKTNLTLTLFKTDFFLNIKYNFEINSKIRRIKLISKLKNSCVG